MRITLIALTALSTISTVAQAETYTREGAFAMKATPAAIEPIYTGKLGDVDPKKNPWRAVTQGKWSREIAKIDATLNKAHWKLKATADYDGDGKPDTAGLYTNGKQTAVIVTFGAQKPPMVIFKDDGSDPGIEIYGHGRRFLLSVPEVGYKILLLYKGKPAMMSQGG